MLFVSKIKDLRLVKKPADRIIDGASRQVVILHGERVEFVGGRYKTDDPEIINWLKSHPEYGRTFSSIDDSEAKKIDELNSQLRILGGARATVDVEPKEDRTDTSSVKGDDIKKYVDERISEAMSSILSEIQTLKSAQSTPRILIKPRSWTCPVPGCGLKFTSGPALGAHKKQAHPELFGGQK